MHGISVLKDDWLFLSLPVLGFALSIWWLGIFSVLGLTLAILTIALIFSVFFVSNTLALITVFTAAFTRGVLQLVGIPPGAVALVAELSALMLLVKAVYVRLVVRRENLQVTGLLPMLGLLAVTAVSYVVNNSELLPAIFFVRQTFIFYLFFIAIQNLNLSQKTVLLINRYLILLFLIQIPAALVKLLIVGPEEGRGIGTVSMQSGTLSTTLPLFACSFLAAFYLFTKEKKYIAWIVGFFFFSMVGLKRAFGFFLPVILFCCWYLYGRRQKSSCLAFSKKGITSGVLLAAITALTFYASARMLTDLNPDGEFWGRFDIKHIFAYMASYNTREYIKGMDLYNSNNTLGRWTIMQRAVGTLENKSLARELIGFGPGAMIRSPHLERSEAAFEQFGIRGAMPGIVILGLQVGYLGVIFIVSFFIALFRRAYVVYQSAERLELKMVALGFLVTTLLVLLDFFAYSISTLSLGVLTPVYFYVGAILLRKDCQGFSLLGHPVSRRARS